MFSAAYLVFGGQTRSHGGLSGRADRERCRPVDGIAGEVYTCCDRYVPDFEVATIAKRISGSTGEILGRRPVPKHQIETRKLQALGMTFGGAALLEKTIAELVESAWR